MQACEFKAYEFLSKDYMTFDASVIVNMSVWAFFKLDNPDMWVSNTGRFHTNEGACGYSEVTDRDAAERHLKRLKFEPYIIEYNLKEDRNVGCAVRCVGLGL